VIFRDTQFDVYKMRRLILMMYDLCNITRWNSLW